MEDEKGVQGAGGQKRKREQERKRDPRWKKHGNAPAVGKKQAKLKSIKASKHAGHRLRSSG